MQKKLLLLSLFASSVLLAGNELDALKAELLQQQKMTQKLLTRIEKLEVKQKKVQEQVALAPKSVNTSASFSQNAYLPDIALILNMSTLGRNVDNNAYQNFAIPGFILKGDTALPFNKDKGFNLNYAEVAMSSTVDPYFDAFAIFHLHPNAFEIEEAYVKTRALPYALSVKAGKFRSAFGRINAKHQHTWHFDSQAIIFKSLFGPDGINDPGLQLQWVAPTDTYMMVGAEAMQGTNGRSFGDTKSNNLYIGYLKSSVDIGDDFSILGGVSIAHGANNDNNTTNATNIYGADLTLREQLGSYSALTWQSEYLYRNKDVGTSKDKQAGLYSELIYQYNNNYSAGFRYDAITKNDTDLTIYAGLNTDNLERYTTMLEYKPFPMSRLRLSFTHDKTKIISGERKTINEVMMSLNIAAGAHGAHDY